MRRASSYPGPRPTASFMNSSGARPSAPNTALPSWSNLQLAPLLERPHQRAAQQHHLDEVVHVPGLQGGVLAVVGEAQQLARLGLDRRHRSAGRAIAAVATTVVAVERPVWLTASPAS